MKFEDSKQLALQKSMDWTPKASSIGKKIGTKIITISDHSKGHPNKNIINCAKTRNCHGSKFKARTQCSIRECPPKYEKIDAKVQEPTNSQTYHGRSFLLLKKLIALK